MPAHSISKCPTGTLVGLSAGAVVLAPSRCKRWACDQCGPKKARRLAKRIQRTKAQRFVTLTIRPAEGESAEEALDRLNRAWRIVWKRIKREQGAKAVGYVRIVELTKRGVPHLHIALDSGFVPQRRLSGWMGAIVGSPIVDIRKIKSERGLARYLAKYLTKAHETLENRRKWSATRRFLPPEDRVPLEEGELPLTWTWVKGDEDHVLTQYLTEGWTVAASLILVAPT